MLRIGIFLLAIGTALVAGCSGGGDSGGGSGRLAVLSDVAPVEDAFNADKGHARLVLLLSPT